jgi:hypothetical protein
VLAPAAGLTYRFAEREAVTVPFGAGLHFDDTEVAYSQPDARVVTAARDSSGPAPHARPAATSASAVAAAGASSRSGGGAGAVAAAALRIDPCDTVAVTVRVTNTGTRATDEVVQLYVEFSSAPISDEGSGHGDHDLPANATLPAPRIHLAGFRRVHLPSGGRAQVVTLVLPPSGRAKVQEVAGAFWDPKRVLEAGTLRLWIGGVQPGFPAFGEPLELSLNVTQTADLAAC